MSVKFLDPSHQLPSPAREQLEACFANIMDAEYQQAFDHLRSLTKDDNDLVRAFSFLYLGDLYHFQWEFPLSLASYEKANNLFGDLDHQRGLIMTRLRVADVVVDEGDATSLPADRKASAREQGASQLAAAVADANNLGDEFLVGFCAHYQALFATEQQDFVEAVAHARRAIEVRERIGDTVYAPSSMALLARARAELGEYEDSVALAEDTYRLQMERHLRGAALRTLAILSYINEQWHMRRTSQLTSQFTPVDPIARTPFLLGEHTEEEMAVAAHGLDDTPLMTAHNNLEGARNALVGDERNLVMMLAS